jgi:SET domain-containing protein
MYRPLPDGLTIKNSPIEGLGLFATKDIKKNTFIGVTHVRDEQFENKYIRTPIGGFYNHSNDPTVIRMVSDVLPKLKFGDPVDPEINSKKLKDGKNDRENMYYNLHEKSDAKYMFLVSIKDIKAGEELAANYNLYTYPKTGIGIQML